MICHSYVYMYTIAMYKETPIHIDDNYIIYMCVIYTATCTCNYTLYICNIAMVTKKHPVTHTFK